MSTTGAFQSPRHARLSIFKWIESFYNRRRRHPALGQLAPETFKQRHYDNLITAAA